MSLSHALPFPNFLFSDISFSKIPSVYKYFPHLSDQELQILPLYQYLHLHNSRYVPAFQYLLLWLQALQNSLASQSKLKSFEVPQFLQCRSLWICKIHLTAPDTDCSLCKTHHIVFQCISKYSRHNNRKPCTVRAVIQCR